MLQAQKYINELSIAHYICPIFWKQTISHINTNNLFLIIPRKTEGGKKLKDFLFIPHIVQNHTAS